MYEIGQLDFVELKSKRLYHVYKLCVYVYIVYRGSTLNVYFICETKGYKIPTFTNRHEVA